MIELLECVNSRGVSPYDRWRKGLDPKVSARVLMSTLRMASGNFSSTKSVGAGVLELRIDSGPGYRVYFGRDGETLILLLGGGTKKRQQDDFEAAKVLWVEYKRTKLKRR